MSDLRQWLDLGLEGLPPSQAGRVRLFRHLLATATQLRLRLDRALAASGVTTQQAAMLQFIEAQPEPPTLGSVAAGLGMTHQNAKQIVRVLERKGFLRIEVDAADRRVRRLVLQPRHQAFWAERNPQDFSGVEAWTAGLADAEVQLLLDLLRKLREGLAASGASEVQDEPAAPEGLTPRKRPRPRAP